MEYLFLALIVIMIVFLVLVFAIAFMKTAQMLKDKKKGDIGIIIISKFFTFALNAIWGGNNKKIHKNKKKKK